MRVRMAFRKRKKNPDEIGLAADMGNIQEICCSILEKLCKACREICKPCGEDEVKELEMRNIKIYDNKPPFIDE